jgi:hypothetical protein
MFKANNKPIGNYASLTNIEKFETKKKNADDFMAKQKDNWNAKKKKSIYTKDMDKPNPRLRAKEDLVNEYYKNELIDAKQANLFMKHLHHHNKRHIKKMLVEIHRNKKSFKQSHEIAKKQDTDLKKKIKKSKIKQSNLR